VTVPLRAEIPRDTASQVSALVRQVRERLAPAVSVGFPDAAAALRAGRGDCNEHAAVFVSLARTAGFPARTVTGLVYLDDPLSPGLYPHAWAEVDLGEPVGWVPVDPALGQGIADATHLRLEGGLRLLDQIRVSSAEVR
jgi:transglutaminase-like putative cysteine protease